MSKFNNKKVEKTVPTKQGGVGYEWSDEIALVMLLAAGTGDKYYQKESATFKELDALMAKVAKKDKLFLAKAIVYARSVLGQRSITHYAAAKLATFLNGEDWGKDFYSKRKRKGNEGGVIFRLDDILEIAGAYKHLNGQEKIKFANSIKKGFAKAIESADPYELAKYKGTGKEISLVDIVNLVHPKAIGENGEAIKALMAGTLKQHDTRQDKNTETGKAVAEAVKSGEVKAKDKEKVLKEAKSANYKELIETKKIGYMDLVRNLRNIINTDTALVPLTKDILLNKKMIDQSKIFPHQIDLAIEILMAETSESSARREIIGYLVQAYELSVDNVKHLNMNGKTAVVYDTSGSMQGGWGAGTMIGPNKTSNSSPVEKAALIAATLGKGLGADIYQFASNCAVVPYNHMDTIHTISGTLIRQIGKVGHGTNFSSIFNGLKDKYDRIFVISDLQGSDECKRSVADYKRKFGIDPYIYSINLCGYGTTSIKPNQKVFPLAGYSAAIYETAKTYEVDPKALITEINNIKF